jgi:hypothetical protein
VGALPSLLAATTPAKKNVALLLRLSAIALALFALPWSAPAAEGRAGGVLTGHVSNAATRASLEGASVRLVGTPREALTDATGRFHFEDLPVGNYTVAVEYTGLEPQSTVIAVAAAARATADFALTSAGSTGSACYRLHRGRLPGNRNM